MDPFPLGSTDDRPALVDAADGTTITYEQLHRLVGRRAEQVAALAGRVVFLGAGSTLEAVLDYLALTQVGATIALLDPATPDPVLTAWIDRYQPDALWGFANRPAHAARERNAAAPRLEALLLATSGSTGSPKFVRLSAAAVRSNAQQIAAALEIEPEHRAYAHLPLFYSYGLSVLNSHLAAGATTVLCRFSAMQPEFWTAMRSTGATSLPGVPYSYEMYRRVGLFTQDLPALRDLTQAGGKLSTERVLEVHEAARQRGIRFWVMYGQTEATARISILHHADLPGAAGSVGRPVDGGSIELVDPTPDGTGEVVFIGPNVMLGYAEGRSDLDGVDLLSGRLDTGDLGQVDAAGRLWITGRLKRIAKVFGTRVSLDDVEAGLRRFGTLAAIDDPQGIAVYVETASRSTATARDMERSLGLPARSIRLVEIDTLPITPAGKINYQALRGH